MHVCDLSNTTVFIAVCFSNKNKWLLLLPVRNGIRSNFICKHLYKEYIKIINKLYVEKVQLFFYKTSYKLQKNITDIYSNISITTFVDYLMPKPSL